MDTRKLRIVKPPLPAIGVCEGCNSRFKSNKLQRTRWRSKLERHLTPHKCELKDDSKNAERVECDFKEEG